MDDRRFAAALVDFAQTLVADYSVQKTLDHLVARAVEVLPVTGAGILLMETEADHHLVAATDDVIVQIEDLQLELGEGPCLLAYRSGSHVAIDDLAADLRFPRFSARAVEAGMAAVYSFPLRVADTSIGALELYSTQPSELSQHDLDGAQTLADVMAAYLCNARLRAHAHTAVLRLQEQALHDTLTGLPNRLLLHDRMEQAVRKSHRSRDTFVGVLFLDVDGLKVVNDSFGHETGDEFLRWVARRTQAVLRPGDTLARLSGDEFVIVCGSLTSERQAVEVAERVLASLKSPLALDGLTVEASVSIGIAFAGYGRGSSAEALRRADATMYDVKREGGGRVQVAGRSVGIPERFGVASTSR